MGLGSGIQKKPIPDLESWVKKNAPDSDPQHCLAALFVCRPVFNTSRLAFYISSILLDANIGDLKLSKFYI
jgi:hypothetical protein